MSQRSGNSIRRLSFIRILVEKEEEKEEMAVDAGAPNDSACIRDARDKDGDVLRNESGVAVEEHCCQDCGGGKWAFKAHTEQTAGLKRL